MAKLRTSKASIMVAPAHGVFTPDPAPRADNSHLEEQSMYSLGQSHVAQFFISLLSNNPEFRFYEPQETQKAEDLIQNLVCSRTQSDVFTAFGMISAMAQSYGNGAQFTVNRPKPDTAVEAAGQTLIFTYQDSHGKIADLNRLDAIADEDVSQFESTHRVQITDFDANSEQPEYLTGFDNSLRAANNPIIPEAFSLPSLAMYKQADNQAIEVTKDEGSAKTQENTDQMTKVLSDAQQRKEAEIARSQNQLTNSVNEASSQQRKVEQKN